MSFRADELEPYRNYLRFLARVQLRDEVGVKLEPSDVVQQSFLQAHQGIENFKGKTEAERIVWLRTILSRVISHAVRYHHQQKRDVRRERSIGVGMDASSARLTFFLASDESSPSQKASRRERAVVIADAVEALPEAQRDAIVLHYWHGKTLAEVALTMQRSPAAIGGLVHRGLKALRSSLHKFEGS